MKNTLTKKTKTIQKPMAGLESDKTSHITSDGIKQLFLADLKSHY